MLEAVGLHPCPICGSEDVTVSNEYDEDGNWVVLCGQCKSSGTFCAEQSKAIEAWNTRADLPRATADIEARLYLAERVARAALLFCDEVSEDSEDVPQVQLKELNTAIDAWEPSLELLDGPFDDTQPALAALQLLLSDPHATDTQRRVAQLAYQVINRAAENTTRLTNTDRVEIARAIAESEIAGSSLENKDIDDLVDLFEAWLERRAPRATGETTVEAALDGIAIIAAERRRQLERENWTPEHDDEHGRGEMAIAGACYAVVGTDASVQYPDDDPEGSGWPWGGRWFKPKDDIRNLARAGALIAAEIDRLLRAAAQTKAERGEQ